MRDMLLVMARAYRMAASRPTTTNPERERWLATAEELEEMAANRG